MLSKTEEVKDGVITSMPFIINKHAPDVSDINPLLSIKIGIIEFENPLFTSKTHSAINIICSTFYFGRKDIT